jgi:hypothetical protein
MALATTWKVPPAGPPPKITLVFAKDGPVKATVINENAQTPSITAISLLLILILLISL